MEGGGDEGLGIDRIMARSWRRWIDFYLVGEGRELAWARRRTEEGC